MDRNLKKSEKIEIQDCIGKLGNTKKCLQRPKFAALQIDRLKRMFEGDKYFLELIEALQKGGYKHGDYEALKDALKEYDLL